MTIEQYFENKEIIELPNLNELGIDAEIFTELTARDLDTDALIVAYKADNSNYLGFIHPDKIEVRKYLFNEDNYMDALTYNSTVSILDCCEFKEYAQMEGSIHIYKDLYHYILTDNIITTIIYNREANIEREYIRKMSQLTNLDLIQELECLLDRKLYPRVEWTIELDKPVVNVCGEDYMTQEEYLKVLTDKLTDSELVELLEKYEVIKEVALKGASSLEELDEVIYIIENELVYKFLEDKKNYSRVKELVLENILN